MKMLNFASNYKIKVNEKNITRFVDLAVFGVVR